MKERRVIWLVILGSAGLVGWRTIREGNDPIPQLAGIGTTGILLLMLSELTPKIASGMAVLMGISFALAWEPTKVRKEESNNVAG